MISVKIRIKKTTAVLAVKITTSPKTPTGRFFIILAFKREFFLRYIKNGIKNNNQARRLKKTINTCGTGLPVANMDRLAISHHESNRKKAIISQLKCLVGLNNSLISHVLTSALPFSTATHPQ